MIIQNVMIRKSFCNARLCLALFFIFAACSPQAVYMGAQGKEVMGTYCRIDLFENGNSGLYEKLFTRLEELEKIFSASRDDSELAEINRNAGLKPVEVSRELYTVLERSLYFSEATYGAFDPTIGPLVRLWGIGTEWAKIPSDGEINAALALVNFRNLELTAGSKHPGKAQLTAGTAFLKKKGMSLDLGAIAKGYAADELISILQKENISRALIDLGGNIYIWGKKDSGELWHVGVQEPLGVRGNIAGILELEGSISVVSSGIYERFFTGDDGKHYHHILELKENENSIHQEGRRGYPAENGVLSTTIIAPSSMDADALSTSCFLLGYEKGLALAAAHGAEVLYIMEKSGIRGSPGAMAIFKLPE